MNMFRVSYIAAVLYAGLGLLGFWLTAGQVNISTIWPPTGIAIGFAIIHGGRAFPGIFLGAFVVDLIALRTTNPGFSSSGNFIEALWVASSVTLQCWFAQKLLRLRPRTHDQLLHTPEGVLALIVLGAAISPIVSTIASAFVFRPNGEGLLHYLSMHLFPWWLGDAVGVLVFTPLVLSVDELLQRPSVSFLQSLRKELRGAPELWAWLIATVISFYFTFGPGAPVLDGRHAPTSFLIWPALLWAGLRFGDVAVHGAVVVVFALSLVWTAQSLGPFALAGESDISMILLSAFGAVTAVSTLFLRAVIVSRDRAEMQLRLSHAELERRVLDRTSQLQESERSYRQLFDKATDAFFVHDAETGIILDTNEAALKLFGRTKEEIVGSDIDILSATQEGFDARRGLERIQEARFGAPMFEWLCRKKSGETFWADVSLKGIEIGGRHRILGIARDITDRKRIEDERSHLLEKEKSLREEAEQGVIMRDEFLSIASHELKTPLTPLMLKLQLLLKDLREKRSLSQDSLQAHLETMVKATEKLARLVDDLLDVSRITSGRLTLEKSRFSLGDLAADIVSRFVPVAERAGYGIRLNIIEDAQGEWDRVRIDQIVTNLLTNAMKYGLEKTIEVEVAREVTSLGTMAVLRVKDQGIGIPQKDQQRIFGRFERAVSASHFGGMGLGLFVSREIARMHHGAIWVKSEPGAGSTFTLLLPLG